MHADFRTDHLTGRALEVALIVNRVLGPRASGGGCRAFYSPEEWRERGERYGLESVLILCHDGGDLSRHCNYDKQDYPAIDRLAAALEEVGCYSESCTSWYSAIYDIEDIPYRV